LTDVQRYLDLHEVAADLLSVSGPIAEAILTAAAERDINLLMLGGYGANPVKEVILGSTVNRVLREAPCPLFICH
jgi:nucleotide-binding universal stress UspA family protein